MKKIGVLNREISEVIARMGHLDMLLIGDAGMPIPACTQRIDLAVTKNLPGFIDTVMAISSELKVERIIIAEETTKVSPQIEKSLLEIFDGVVVDHVTHDELKKLSAQAVAAVRTGEFTPYANVVLVSGVVF
jgi:D-ribose pyranase